MTDLSVHTTPIPGVLVIDLPLHGDSRGWFKENWQRAKMVALGLPDFAPVQNNMSYNEEAGVTRGLHAEPWDKLISLATGRILGAWVDLREGPSFGQTFTLEMGPEKAVYIPRGVANGYQALEPKTTYSYLVNDHWSPEAKKSYTFVNLADETVGIDWPIPLDRAIVSDADKAHPKLADVTPFPGPRTVIVGASGQLGQALQKVLPDADALTQDDLDLTDADAVASYPWSGVTTIINAAAYTAVDVAETESGRIAAWKINVEAVARLAEVARANRATLVHISTDYVFDGTSTDHDEDEALSPLGVYGQTKAAADVIVATVPRHYVVRTSWVIGEGTNFVRTMAGLAAKGVKPSVVDDQYGRLTFTDDLARGIVHLVESGAPFGTYNLTSQGPIVTWCDVAKRVYELTGHSADDVSPTSTEEYGRGKQMAPRPTHSVLRLDKIQAAGFEPVDGDEALVAYLQAERA
ncbi:sugar nucleotide-binding protein [Nigerium massiliense]|uniref:sugar nucleotide-binding protein n=1 Tax=Nigerium massiliense TaxID=1522317 RepID=UPI00058D327A|nr:sugar nucleotide-binding protein [Nigerium massiliense]